MYSWSFHGSILHVEERIGLALIFLREKKKGHASKEKRGVIEHLEVTQRCDSIEYILVFLLLVKTM